MLVIYVAIVLIAVYAGIVATAYLMQDRMLFRSTKKVVRSPEAMGWNFSEAWLDVNGYHTLTWYIPARDVSMKHLIIFSHGNAGNISDRLESVSIFRELGYAVLVYDYGGYGESTGRTTEARCCADLRAVWRHATETLEYAPGNIVLFGRSLGSGPTAQVATEVFPGAVVLESAFTSIPDLVRTLYPLLPGWVMSRNRFDNAVKVGEIHAPILIVHGEKDSLIPYAHGKSLFAKANEPKAFLDIDGEHHEGFWMSGTDYTDGLSEFFNQHLR